VRSRRKDQGQCSASVFRCSRSRQRSDVYPISVMSRMESCGADMFVSGDVVSCFANNVHVCCCGSACVGKGKRCSPGLGILSNKHHRFLVFDLWRVSSFSSFDNYRICIAIALCSSPSTPSQHARPQSSASATITRFLFKRR